MKFWIITFLLSIITILVYYLIIENFIIGKIIGLDIDIIWDAISGPLSEIYNENNTDFIYLPHFWYQFWIFRFSKPVFVGFMIISHIISFPTGLYLINKKFNLKHPYILMLIIYPAFSMDIIVRNFNTLIFLIIALIIYYCDKKPLLAGLMFWLIGFKITSIIIVVLVFFIDKHTMKRNFITGIFISIILMYIFFPLSKFSLLDYWNAISINTTIENKSFDFAITVSRAIRFNHMIWIVPTVFSASYYYFIKKNTVLIKNNQIQSKILKNCFKKSIIVSFIFEVIFGSLGLITYLKYLKII
ncbi:MAG: hypothetical protein ACTSWY_05470 [Promethearchaeota archaeon]